MKQDSSAQCCINDTDENFNIGLKLLVLLLLTCYNKKHSDINHKTKIEQKGLYWDLWTVTSFW